MGKRRKKVQDFGHGPVQMESGRGAGPWGGKLRRQAAKPVDRATGESAQQKAAGETARQTQQRLTGAGDNRGESARQTQQRLAAGSTGERLAQARNAAVPTGAQGMGGPRWKGGAGCAGCPRVDGMRAPQIVGVHQWVLPQELAGGGKELRYCAKCAQDTPDRRWVRVHKLGGAAPAPGAGAAKRKQDWEEAGCRRQVQGEDRAAVHNRKQQVRKLEQVQIRGPSRRDKHPFQNKALRGDQSKEGQDNAANMLTSRSRGGAARSGAKRTGNRHTDAAVHRDAVVIVQL
jgi:hypothetical protein